MNTYPHPLLCFVLYDFAHNALLDLQQASKILRNGNFKIKREAGNWIMKSCVLY